MNMTLNSKRWIWMGLGALLVTASFLPAQDSLDQFACLSEKRPTKKERYLTTGVDDLDKLCKSEAARLCKAFGVRPYFWFLGPRSETQVAVSRPNTRSRRPQYVSFNSGLLNRLWRSKGKQVTVVATMAHMYAHVAQWDRNCILQAQPRELLADHIAGYYIATRGLAKDKSPKQVARQYLADAARAYPEETAFGNKERRIAEFVSGMAARALTFDGVYKAALARLASENPELVPVLQNRPGEDQPGAQPQPQQPSGKPGAGPASGGAGPAPKGGKRGPQHGMTVRVPCTHTTPCSHKIPCKHMKKCIHRVPCVHDITCRHRVKCVHRSPCRHQVRCRHQVECRHKEHEYDLAHAYDLDRNGKERPCRHKVECCHTEHRYDLEHRWDLAHRHDTAHEYDLAHKRDFRHSRDIAHKGGDPQHKWDREHRYDRPHEFDEVQKPKTDRK